MKNVVVKTAHDGKVIYEKPFDEFSASMQKEIVRASKKETTLEKLLEIKIELIDTELNPSTDGEPTTVPPSQQESEPDTRPSPKGGAILYLPATCGWFNASGTQMLDTFFAVSKIGSDAGVSGRVGLCFEVTGSTGNLGERTKDFKTAYAAHCHAIETTIHECVRLGVPVKIDGINSNDFGKGWAASWKDTKENRAFILSETKQLAEELLPYSAWLIVQPVAENDSAMKPDFREAVRREWLVAGWKSSRLAGPGKAGGAGINEIHISGVKKTASTGKTDFVSTDNGDGIVAHFEGGGVWTAHKPKVAACISSAKAHLSRGTSFALYHRSPQLHIVDHAALYFEIVKSVAPLLGSSESSSSSPAQSSGAVLHEVKKSPKEFYIDFSYSGLEKWPEGKEKIRGWITVNGNRVEQFRTGYKSQHLKNIYGKKYPVKGIKKGDTVQIALQSTDGKQNTNSLPFAWPWKNT